MNLQTKQVADQTGLQDHQIRYLIKRYDIPHSQEIGGTKLYHPWLVAWVLALREDEAVLEHRTKLRTQLLIKAIQEEQQAPTLPAPTTDFGLRSLATGGTA